ncbi:MAG: hypothetical protein J7L98_07250 [Candidatus Verstraetearchaeota archaeon]|nr:hypothetical protein [Candidatus Verstraetearchaeota archaeon]
MPFLLTTSRRPAQRVRSFCNDIVHISPKTFLKQNRGKRNLAELAVEIYDKNLDGMILVSTSKGNPGKIDFYTIVGGGKLRRLLAMIIGGVKLLREMPYKAPRIPFRKLYVAYIEPQEELVTLATSLSKALKAPLINLFAPPDNGAVIRVEPSRKFLAALSIRDLESQLPCGPLINVKFFYYLGDEGWTRVPPLP